MKLITVTQAWLNRPGRYVRRNSTEEIQKVCGHCGEEFQLGDKIWSQPSSGRGASLATKYTCQTCEDKRRY